jgi:hypothetical protein
MCLSPQGAWRSILDGSIDFLSGQSVLSIL